LFLDRCGGIAASTVDRRRANYETHLKSSISKTSNDKT
jgi:hypothetical protein